MFICRMLWLVMSLGCFDRLGYRAFFDQLRHVVAWKDYRLIEPLVKYLVALSQSWRVISYIPDSLSAWNHYLYAAEKKSEDEEQDTPGLGHSKNVGFEPLIRLPKAGPHLRGESYYRDVPLRA